jgi:hypothetical protein
MQLFDHRRLTSPEGRNHMPLYVDVAVAARPDDRASCPATAASPPSEENHARTRFGTASVGEEADPATAPDPPLAHRVPEGGVVHSPVPGRYHASPPRSNRFRCNLFMPATPN